MVGNPAQRTEKTGRARKALEVAAEDDELKSQAEGILSQLGYVGLRSFFSVSTTTRTIAPMPKHAANSIAESGIV